MQKSNYDVHILVNGKKVKEYKKDGQVFIEGRKNNNYSLRIKNNSYGKIVAVMTIDGLSVLDGKLGSYRSTGYVVDGHSSLTIDGWRETNESVRKFFFTDPSKSYAKGTGQSGNEGIIGVAIFEEKCNIRSPFKDVERQAPVPYLPRETWPIVVPMTPNPYPQYPQSLWGISWNAQSSEGLSGQSIGASSLSANVLRCKSAPAQIKNCAEKADLGTGWGEEKRSVVDQVAFDRKDNSEAVFEIRYATRKSLKEMGVIQNKAKVSVAPNAFPGEFCAPPKFR